MERQSEFRRYVLYAMDFINKNAAPRQIIQKVYVFPGNIEASNYYSKVDETMRCSAVIV
jgi:hypothetical protein